MQDVKAIGEIARKHGILFHSDASQSFCKYDLDVEALNIDLLTVSGYKIGAPKGIAALYVRDKTALRPILFGSGDPFFPGTKSTASIASFAAAVEHFSFDKNRINENFRVLASELSKIDDIYINSSTPSHVLSVSIGGVLLKDVLKRMKNYSFSAGCSCLGQEKSNVIQAIDPDGKLPSCTLRISFSDQIRLEDLVEFAKNLRKTVNLLRGAKSVGTGCQSDKSSEDLNESLKKIHEALSLSAG
jgi:cysteine desulfurase